MCWLYGHLSHLLRYLFVHVGNTTASAVKTILDNRYSGCGSGFNTDLSNAWENYYYVKESTIGDVYTRSAAADSSISAI